MTIEGVEAVIDSGFARVAKYDPWSGRPSLEVARISRASATQRAGRAGRLGPGRAMRLYTKGDFEARPEHDVPGDFARRHGRGAAHAALVAGRGHGTAGLARSRRPKPRCAAPNSSCTRLGAQDGRRGAHAARAANADVRSAAAVVEARHRGGGARGARRRVHGRGDARRGARCLRSIVGRRGRRAPGADGQSDLSERLARIDEATEGGFDRQRAKRLGLVPESVIAVRKGAEQILRACRAAGVTAGSGHGERGRSRSSRAPRGVSRSRGAAPSGAGGEHAARCEPRVASVRRGHGGARRDERRPNGALARRRRGRRPARRRSDAPLRPSRKAADAGVAGERDSSRSGSSTFFPAP